MLAHLVVAAVFKTVVPRVNRAAGGFDSHALPFFNRVSRRPSMGCRTFDFTLSENPVDGRLGRNPFYEKHLRLSFPFSSIGKISQWVIDPVVGSDYNSPGYRVRRSGLVGQCENCFVRPW